jgi:UDP-glucose 6-dehydrogenase
MAVAFAMAGQRVVINDIDLAVLAKIQSGQVPFLEADCERMLQEVLGRTLFTSHSY